MGTTNTSWRENIRNVTTALPLGTSRSSFSSKCQTSLQGKTLRIIKTSTHRPKTASKMEGFNMSFSDFLDIFPHFSYQFLHLFVLSKALWNCVNLWSFWKVDTQHLNNSWRQFALANLQKIPWKCHGFLHLLWPPLPATLASTTREVTTWCSKITSTKYRSFIKRNSWTPVSFKNWGQCCIKIHLPNLGALVWQGHKEKEVVTCSNHSSGLWIDTKWYDIFHKIHVYLVDFAKQ